MQDGQEHDREAAAAGAAEGAGNRSAGADPLLEVRAALDEVHGLPLEERAEVFERTHRVVVDELRMLELG